MNCFRKYCMIGILSAVLGILCSGTARADSSMPMLVPGDGWYPFSVAKSNILSVEFRDTYETDGTEVAVKNTDVNGTGEIRSYLLAGRKKVIVAGNGSGGILANPDCSGMFEGFTLLQTVDFKIVYTTYVNWMDVMFKDCCLLEEIDLRDIETKNVIAMNGMFMNCSALLGVDLQYWDLSNVKDTSYMFSNCASISSLSFPMVEGCILENVTCMFLDCYELMNLDLSGLQIGRVKSMQKMFQNCSSLTVLDLSTWDTKELKDISWLFSGCENLKKIYLNSWDTGKVKHMDMMFDQCSSLTEIAIHWNTSSLTTAEGLFNGCAALKEINLSGFEGRGLLNIDGMFAGCTGLERLDLSGMKLESVVSSTQSDLFGDTVYSKLTDFQPPLGVRISMKMPDTGNGRFMLDGSVLEQMPKNLETPLNLSVYYQIDFLDSEDDTSYGRETVEFGSIVATPSQPVKESQDYAYAFLGWCLEDGTAYRTEPVCSDLTVYAFWDKTEKQKEVGTVPEDPAEDLKEPDVTSKEEPADSGSTGSGGSGSSGGSGTSGGGSSSSGGSSGGGSSGGGSSGGGGGSGLSYRSTGTTPSGSKLTVANASATFSSFWQADTTGTWRIIRPDGRAVTSAWLCDDAVTANGKDVWYLIGTTGEMLSCGLVQDNTGNYYSLETEHNGYYGMLRYRNGFYSCGTETLYITFDHNHNGSFGAVTSPEALEALKRIYGVTRFPIGNENCIYTSTF